MPNKYFKGLILTFACFFLFQSLALAGTKTLFSPEDKIKENLVKEVNNSKRSIDIAVFKFTSADLAESLIAAQKRKVKIRMVADLGEATKENSKVTHLIEKGIKVKLMKGAGSGGMHHNFALFDQRVLFVSSKSWGDEPEKDSYENAFFTSAQPLVTNYLKAFNRLFQK